MKKILLFGFLCIGWASFSQKPVSLKLKKAERLELNPMELEKEKKFNLGMPPNIRVVKNYAYPSKDHVFFMGKNPKGGTIVLILRELPEIGILELPYAHYFDTVGPDETKAWYCSCDSKMAVSKKDNCKVQLTGQGFRCAGGCSAEKQSTGCSITSIDLTTGVVEQQY